jgi:hypothetical protein
MASDLASAFQEPDQTRLSSAISSLWPSIDDCTALYSQKVRGSAVFEKGKTPWPWVLPADCSTRADATNLLQLFEKLCKYIELDFRDAFRNHSATRTQDSAVTWR